MKAEQTTDKPRCKADILERWSRWPRFHQCPKAAVRDGYCNVHHPDNVKARDAARSAKFNAEWEAGKVRSACRHGVHDFACQVAIVALLQRLRTETTTPFAAYTETWMNVVKEMLCYDDDV